ncbi:uncharacterized protein BP01DRAFT_268809, partial [Aspergillus saccharolyticus JOP 1030-1]
MNNQIIQQSDRILQLNQSCDWILWINQIRLFAINKGIWELVNPELPTEPAYPIRPSAISVKQIKSSANSIIDLNESDRLLYQEAKQDYHQNLKEFNETASGLASLSLLINSTLSKQNQHAILNLEKPYQILRALRNRLAPTNQSRKRDLINRYHRLRTSTKGPIESHISQWELIYSEAVELQISEVKEPIRVLFDFLESIHETMGTFASIWQSRLIEIENSQEEIPDFL